MIYYFKCNLLPKIDSVYSVIRRTVWKIADPFHIIIFIKNGNCRIEINNNIYDLTAGDLFFIPANTVYTRRPVNNEFCEIFYIHFSLSGVIREYDNSASIARDFMWKNIKGTFTESSFSFFLPHKFRFKEEANQVYKRISVIKKYYNGNNSFDYQATSFSLCAFLSDISNEYISRVLIKENEKEVESYPDALKKALLYIKNHYTEPITLNDLCKVSFVSKQMIIRHFNKYLQKSPSVYIIEYKINRIKPLLIRYPTMSIKEICNEFGFEDQCYFSRIFKKHTGESPTEYRNRVINFNQEKHLLNN